MQDRPDAPELLAAVRRFLEQEVAGALEGRARFHLRVAVNALGILEREWRWEEDAVRAEWERLCALLGAPGPRPGSFAALRRAVRELNAQLCARIRSGQLDDRWDELIEALRATVADKLAIANPNYARR